MASGRLGALTGATTTTLTEIYQVPANTVSTVSICLCNRSTEARTIRIAHIDADTVASVAGEDYIEYGAVIPASGVLERTGIVMAAGHILAVYSSAINVSSQVYGWEESV